MTKGILIVEPNGYLSETLTNLLNSFGFKVVGATANTSEILSMVQDFDPDLILTDFDLSQKLDIGFIKGQYPNLKIIAYGVNEAVDGFAELARKAGLDGFYCKYSSQKILLESINTALS